ncbi:MAG: sugar ABC transporter ATP-binding protein [Hyphomicrobium sp. 32-62-53]|nr:MAG: sugar ABC transporter ATP-binding protein [Hyphomicrobium sp. 32-62-53]
MAHVVLDDVCVSFPIYGQSSQSLKKRVIGSVVGGGLTHTDGMPVVVNALSDVCMELVDGDRLGLIGHNGAGKTTLLRVIAGIYPAVSGKMTIDGRVTPLIDTRLGLEMEGTGYENILLRGLYLGHDRAAIDAAIGDIADFSELGEYLDLPVRTYSSGMLSRLLFAISTAFDPEILVLDEGIGAGDAAFMGRIRQRTDAFMKTASIVVMASHSDAFIQAHCNIGAVMEHGRIKSFGEVGEQIKLYQQGIQR